MSVSLSIQVVVSLRSCQFMTSFHSSRIKAGTFRAQVSWGPNLEWPTVSNGTICYDYDFFFQIHEETYSFALLLNFINKNIENCG